MHGWGCAIAAPERINDGVSRNHLTSPKRDWFFEVSGVGRRNAAIIRYCEIVARVMD